MRTHNVRRHGDRAPEFNTLFIGRISSSTRWRTEFNRLWLNFAGRLLYTCFNHYIFSHCLKCLAWYVTLSLSLSLFFFCYWQPLFCTEKSQPTRTKFEYRTVACNAAILTVFGVLKDYSVTDFVLAFVTVNLKTLLYWLFHPNFIKNRKKINNPPSVADFLLSLVPIIVKMVLLLQVIFPSALCVLTLDSFIGARFVLTRLLSRGLLFFC